MLALSGCASPPATPDFCLWATKIIPDQGFESRWTTEEKREVLTYDDQLGKFCRQPTQQDTK